MIGVEGAQTPREEGTGETPQAQAEEAHGPPAGKRSAWNGNQLYYYILLSSKKRASSHIDDC
ncbi:hypothetical protein FZC74_19080 [Sutcliffiella horikoshii]|uniref:Uncharacterized protein n=1 Tax=Sutcliffiella horikoshii TaxID=79883 RepID=A0AA94WJD3_9BACI|nr:hypothetical protein FZC74_19080 [Sutcliffiella horikoshii]